MADDVSAHADRVELLQLRLLLSGEPGPEHIKVKFNGIELRDSVNKDGWWTFALKPPQMAVGRNLATIRDTRPPATENKTVLEKVEVHVKYGSRENVP